MNLAEYESRAVELCFARVASDEELASLGDPSRWRTYRNMVRARLQRVCENGLPRTVDALGSDRFETLFADWLHEAPLRERYFRDVPMHFLAFASEQLAAQPEPWLSDLAEYELTTWRVKYADDRGVPELVDVSFELPIQLNPALEMLDVKWAVHDASPTHGYAEETLHYCIYRGADFRSITMVLTPMARNLVHAWLSGEGALSEQIKQVTAERNRTIDEGFVDGLSTMMADFIERGIVLGSRAS